MSFGKRRKKETVSPTLIRLKELRLVEYKKRVVPLKEGGKKRSRDVSLEGF